MMRDLRRIDLSVEKLPVFINKYAQSIQSDPYDILSRILYYKNKRKKFEKRKKAYKSLFSSKKIKFKYCET